MVFTDKRNDLARPCRCRAFVSLAKRTVSASLFCQKNPRQAFAAVVIFLVVWAAGLSLDLWTKKAAFDYLRHKGSVTVLDGFIQFVAVENPGAAFGMASGQQYLLIITSVAALIIIVGVFLFGQSDRKAFYIVLGLLAGGVCGNLYDRVFNNGLVRDFIDVYYRQYHWPAFNIADSILCVGVAVLIILSFQTSRQRHRL